MSQGLRHVSVQDLNLPAALVKEIELLAKKEGSAKIDHIEEFRQAAYTLNRMREGMEYALFRLSEVTDVSRYEDYVPRVVDLLPPGLQQRVVAIQKHGDPAKLDKDERLEIAHLLENVRDRLVASAQRLMTAASTDTTALLFFRYGYRAGLPFGPYPFHFSLYEVEDGNIYYSEGSKNRRLLYDGNGSYRDQTVRFRTGKAIKLETDGNGLSVLLEGLKGYAAFAWGDKLEMAFGIPPGPIPAFLHVHIPPNWPTEIPRRVVIPLRFPRD